MPRTKPLLLSSILTFMSLLSGDVPTAAAGSKAKKPESLEVFKKSFSLVLENYVDEPTPYYLLSSAMLGIDEYLESMDSPHEAQSPDIPKNANMETALDSFSKAFEKIEKRSGLPSLEIEYAAIEGMLGALDPHSSLMRKKMLEAFRVETRGEFGGLGIQISLKNKVLTVTTPIDDTPAFKAGLAAGDRILRIDGEPTKGLTLEECVMRLRGLKGTSVTLAIMRDGFEASKDFTLTRDTIKIESVKHESHEGGIGYIRISQFQETTPREVERALMKLGSRRAELKGLVLDLRNNPGGLLNSTIEIADKFIEEGLIASMKTRVSANDVTYTAKKFGTHTGCPIIILLNTGTAAGAEILAGSLRAHGRAVLLGERTFGKATTQTVYDLPDGSAMKLSTYRAVLLNGRLPDDGLIPDIPLKRTEEHDSLVPTALKALRGNKKRRHVRPEDILTLVRNVLAGEPESREPAGSETTAPQSSVSVDRDIPQTKTINRDAIAVVIGNRDYRNAKSVDFALNDSRSVKRYLTSAMGFREGNIFHIENAAKGDFELYFGIEGNHKGKLFNAVKPGRSDVFVFYSGHGAPGLNDKKGYFVPVEADPHYIELGGYPLDTFYENLGMISARSMTVVLDSCFSGATIFENISPLVMQISAPKSGLTNGVVISSSKGSQVSSWNKDQRHGMFTYFFLKAIHDKNADADKDDRLTFDEIYRYISDEAEGVPYYARRMHGVEQLPTIQGDFKGKTFLRY
ncbi:MAG: S41 family peptidase [Elusimicrobiota bacterium]